MLEMSTCGFMNYLQRPTQVENRSKAQPGAAGDGPLEDENREGRSWRSSLDVLCQ